jgi:uncharacterized protein YbaR (Trm112 family)
LINDEFLTMLRCPESQQPLSRGDAALVERLNRQIVAGRLLNRAGQPLERAIDGVLVRHDNQVAYPIIDDIPILLVDEAIELEGT